MIKVCLQRWFLFLKEDTPVDFPKPQPVQERKKKKIVAE
jgi:hypothetical protein